MNNGNQVDKYLSGFEGDVLERLNKMRKIIKKLAPEATEGIFYGMPGYKINGKPLVYFAGYKNHVGFYAIPNTHEKFAKDFAKYKQGKGSVQFPNNQALPTDLIERVVKYRIAIISA